ncbi:hypothetical protein [Pontibacter anaerobius]|uniref:AbiV family abortive infection protein n=1 Tax=Pontibacter anaerobius TaxID=2993940 RepID=A0ABT3RGZ6_9BACT|nr:hypothetical protein [Pontibacter anaerobius]MCX2740530.1 hypothetical protein [Pontibacter anaerobius]
MNNKVEEGLKRLESLDKVVIEAAKEMVHDENMYPLDLLANAVLNRTLSTISGFVLLTRANNFNCAAHLIRLHLDNLLRFSAAWIVDNPHDFAMKVLSGEQINHLKDISGNKMHDGYLVDQLSVKYPWVKRVYKETSGFVHLSHKHIFNSTKLKDIEQRTIAFSISKEDYFVDDQLRVEATELMIEITNCICDFIKGWTWTKKHPPK